MRTILSSTQIKLKLIASGSDSRAVGCCDRVWPKSDDGKESGTVAGTQSEWR